MSVMQKVEQRVMSVMQKVYVRGTKGCVCHAKGVCVRGAKGCVSRTSWSTGVCLSCKRCVSEHQRGVSVMKMLVSVEQRSVSVIQKVEQRVVSVMLKVEQRGVRHAKSL